MLSTMSPSLYCDHCVLNPLYFMKILQMAAPHKSVLLYPNLDDTKDTNGSGQVCFIQKKLWLLCPSGQSIPAPTPPRSSGLWGVWIKERCPSFTQHPGTVSDSGATTNYIPGFKETVAFLGSGLKQSCTLSKSVEIMD